jgi:hypothetical protein
MMKFSSLLYRFSIQHSLFDIRYSFSAHGKLIVIELLTVKELAEHLLRNRLVSYFPIPSYEG